MSSLRCAFVLLAALLLSLCSAEGANMSTVCPKKLGWESQKSSCHSATVKKWHELVLGRSQEQNLEDALGFLTDDVIFRVDPVGVFKGINNVAEYIIIFSSPSGVVNILQPQAVQRQYFLNYGDVSSQTYNINFKNILTGLTANLTIISTIHFDNKTNRIDRADFNVQRYTYFLDELQTYSVLTPVVAEFSLLRPTCTTAMQYCVGANKQYNSTSECVSFLKTKELISPHSVASDTVTCRYLHSGFVQALPDTHCVHVGPSGGDFCIEHQYTEYYTVFTSKDFKP